MLISSLHNPRVKQAIKLRERREREHTGLMLVEGYDELSLALASGAKPLTIFLCKDFPGFKDLADLKSLERQGGELVEVTAPVFEKMAYREGPDGWLAVMPSLHGSLNSLSQTARPLLLVAEAIEKPGNLGAMLRSADAAGVEGVIVCDPTTDINNPNVVRSSKGTLFSVPVALATSAEACDWLRQHKITIVAATPQAKTVYTQADLRGPAAIVVGTEKEGLTSLWLEAADVAVRIPMCGRVNSLNVATAATLMLYEAVRQRNDK